MSDVAQMSTPGTMAMTITVVTTDGCSTTHTYSSPSSPDEVQAMMDEVLTLTSLTIQGGWRVVLLKCPSVIYNIDHIVRITLTGPEKLVEEVQTQTNKRRMGFSTPQ